MPDPLRTLCRTTTLLVVAAVPLAAQTAWSPLTPTTSPPARNRHALAPFPPGVLLFGGATSAYVGDTWEWNGTDWRPLAPTRSPPARGDHAMVHDPVRQRIVLFGGGTTTASFGDTWEWDGSDWTQLAPAQSPPPRAVHAMAYDPVRRRVVLFGGASPAFRNDTWEWDGTSWSAPTPPTSPSARHGHAMAFDPVRQRMLLFGGLDGLMRDDTWEWDGSNWSRLAPSRNPGARHSHVMVTDALRNRVVLFGGRTGTSGGTYLDDTWEWDGNDWILRQPAVRPMRRVPELTYDPVRARTVLFGGLSDLVMGPLGDTWDYTTQSPPAHAAFGTGCRGSAGIPTLAAAPGQLPWVGARFDVQLASLPSASPLLMLLGSSKTVWGTIPLPLDLVAIGMPRCLLSVSPDIVQPLSSSGGMATWSLAIPDDPSLAGLSFFHQAIVGDPSANAFGATVTNPAEGRCGMK